MIKIDKIKAFIIISAITVFALGIFDLQSHSSGGHGHSETVGPRDSHAH